MIELPTLPPIVAPSRRKLASARAFLAANRAVYRHQSKPVAALLAAVDDAEENVRALDLLRGSLGDDTLSILAVCKVIRSLPALLQLGAGGAVRPATAFAMELMQAVEVVLLHETVKAQRRHARAKKRAAGKGGKP